MEMSVLASDCGDCFLFNTVFTIVTLFKKIEDTRNSLRENVVWRQIILNSFKSIETPSDRTNQKSRSKNVHLKRLVDPQEHQLLFLNFAFLFLANISGNQEDSRPENSILKFRKSLSVCVCVKESLFITVCLYVCYVCLSVSAGEVQKDEKGEKKATMLTVL